jgi:molecular chaperone GrpE
MDKKHKREHEEPELEAVEAVETAETDVGDETDEAAQEASRHEMAKAFMRAVNAGMEVKPGDFGLGGGGGGEAPSSGPCRNCQDLETRLAQMTQKAQDADGHYRRMAADFENYRKRVDREREDFLGHGIKKAVEAMLPALDDLDRAQQSLSTDLSPEKLMESLNLICNSVKRSLEMIGVKSMDVLGEHFDPRLHEPVQNVETTEARDGTVLHELRRGYTLNDKVIRPALVNVASNHLDDSTVQGANELGDSVDETEASVADRYEIPEDVLDKSIDIVAQVDTEQGDDGGERA